MKGATSLGLSAVKSIGGLVKGMSPWVKGGGALAALGAGIKIADTYQNAKTKDEKAEGYGGAAGGLAGAMIGTKAGMAFGAAIGTIVPGLGTAIGGAVGPW